MTKFNWSALTSHTETPAKPESTETPNSIPTHRRDSKLSHIMDSIRHGLAHDHERLPPQNGAEQPPQVAAAAQPTPPNGSVSPSLQATAATKLNENNMGPANSHENDDVWGWPGLGTYKSHDSPTPSQASKSRTGSTQSTGQVAVRVEAATTEAIDNAAESEPYGWPGLGDFVSSSPKK